MDFVAKIRNKYSCFVKGCSVKGNLFALILTNLNFGKYTYIVIRKLFWIININWVKNSNIKIFYYVMKIINPIYYTSTEKLNVISFLTAVANETWIHLAFRVGIKFKSLSTLHLHLKVVISKNEMRKTDGCISKLKTNWVHSQLSMLISVQWLQIKLILNWILMSILLTWSGKFN